jgi:hypothetical protein
MGHYPYSLYESQSTNGSTITATPNDTIPQIRNCVNSRTRLAIAGSTGRRSMELAP